MNQPGLAKHAEILILISWAPAGSQLSDVGLLFQFLVGAKVAP